MRIASTTLLLPAAILTLVTALSATGQNGGEDTAPAGDQTAAPPLPPAVQAAMARGGAPGGPSADNLPKLDDVAKGYEKVVSTADGAASLYTLWKREKDAQMLAELPSNFASQKLFIAYTVAAGTTSSGVQTGDMYAYWKKFDKRLALIQPNYETRSTGDAESKRGRDRVFTDRVLLDVPIVARGARGGLVIDLDALLLGRASSFFGGVAGGANARLATIEKAKAFPSNVEVAFRLPLAGGRFGTLHYSISAMPARTGYQPRVADARVGYFATAYRDIGHPDRDTPTVRYINRWHLEKADASLRMSPPKQPIVFYLEHTIPVRYRRWVREGVLEWNKAFERVGIVNALEVYQQDARTGAHMEKDPEDARYNFVLWTNSNMGYAIGPSRVDPRTGQILDADIVMDEGFITSWVNTWEDQIVETAMTDFGPQTLAWLATRPQFDPRVRLAPPNERPHRLQALRAQHAQNYGAPYASHPGAGADAVMLGDQQYDGLANRVSQVNGRCDCARHVGSELALFRMSPELLLSLINGDEDDEEDKDEEDDADEEDGEEAEGDDDDTPEPKPDPGQILDGIPESFVGPMLRDVIMHEVGHTLGLRHNFKASTVYTLEEINSESWGDKPITGSVMDYIPANIAFKAGDSQGPFAMTTLGPYDEWAIEYGYTFERDLKPILARANEPELIYGTDEDSFGSDPRARTFDLGTNPLDFCDSQMALVAHLRGKIIDSFVKDGESWDKARRTYEMLLRKHVSAVGVASNWLGGVQTSRLKKGDAEGDAQPITPVDGDQQRRALDFVIDNVFDDEAFGLTPELVAHLGVERWYDDMSTVFASDAFPIHDRILGVQSTALTQLMNPGTLSGVYDNEIRANGDDDALTLPELLETIQEEIWSDMGEASSLRRNLQREHLDRLIDLCLPNGAMGTVGKPLSQLACMYLGELDGDMEKTLDRKKVDAWNRAHLKEARSQIARALDAQYIYNTDDIGGGGGGGRSFPFPF